MEKPRIPSNESARLATLLALDILDTKPEERFDRYTRLAKKLFDVPISLVSLVDAERQWFKSRQGTEMTETPREVSFCGHAILGDQIFIINDATNDQRFIDNPLVITEPSICFYAGRPIKAPDGNKIGTLCIIDHKPKAFDQDDIEALDDLAQLVEQEFRSTIHSTTDKLTGLTNRRGFMEISKHILTVCERTGIPATLLYFDIDNHKQIRNKQGRQQADRAIFELAKLLLDTFRTSDIIARLGDDEFIVFLIGADKISAQIPLHRFYTTLELFNSDSPAPFELHVSQGMVSYEGTQHHCITDLLAEADTSMYVNRKMKAR